MKSSLPTWLATLRALPRFVRNQARLMRSQDASLYYTILGDDVLELRHDGPVDSEKPLWLNMGYWKNSGHYPQACEDLARFVAEFAEFKPQDRILDAGFGFAEQDVFWVKEFSVGHITGVNITRAQVEKAIRRVKAENLEHKIQLHLDSATTFPLVENAFDKVVALESSFHFDTREAFMQRAFKMLKPGGRIAFTDLLPEEEGQVNGWFQKRMRRRIFWPEANYHGLQVYEQKLKNAGFTNIKSTSIAHQTLAPMASWVFSRYLGQGEGQIELSSPQTETDKKRLWFWRYVLGISDYRVITADKT